MAHVYLKIVWGQIHILVADGHLQQHNGHLQQEQHQ